jgi:endonuclease/exonuclease/phosphatase family metal-dependent hydrolase
MLKKIISLLLFFSFSLLSSAQQQIKVMSYNIRLDVASDGENRWDARKDKLAGLMKYHEADFIGCQEVQHHQLQYIQSVLSEYDHIGVGRDDGKEAGEYSCIFYKKDRFEVVKQSTFWLSPTPNVVSKGWDAAYNRVCTYGLFKNKKTKQLFWVFNTHFDHIGKTAMLESAKLITAKIKELNTKNYPVILSGDLNSKPEEPPIQYLNTTMQNTRTISEEVYGPLETFNEFKFTSKIIRCIDYIFISNENRLKVKKFATLTDSYDMKYPSDHLPVMATIEMRK